jgi:UPF0755 protein
MRWRLALAALPVLIGIAAGAAFLWLDQGFRAPGPATAEIIVDIPRGEGVRAISRRLADAGVIPRPPLLFDVSLRLFGGERPLRAGEYAFPAGTSMAEVAMRLQEGRVVVHRLTVPEGLTVAQILALVAAEPLLSGDLPRPPPEGRLLPETYGFAKGDSRSALVDRMAEAMKRTLGEAMPQLAPGLPYSTEAEVLTLASIVEKETGIPAERAQVAGVFVNRLRLGMRLQSDPTVIYGLTQGQGPLDRSLTRADLERPSAHNTYVITGLPASPIANPGRAAIEAVLRPLATEHLYFVADGKGGHAFAPTLAEHNANVRRWLEGRRRANTAPVAAP